MKLFRLPGWEVRMREAIEARALLPFDIVSNDCVKFTAWILYAITKEDVTHLFPSYASEREARLELIRLGPGGFFNQVDAILVSLGLTKVGWRSASRGDVVWYEIAEGKSLAICDGAFALSPGTNSLQSIPMSMCKAAWSIPHGT